MDVRTLPPLALLALAVLVAACARMPPTPSTHLWTPTRPATAPTAPAASAAPERPAVSPTPVASDPIPAPAPPPNDTVHRSTLKAGTSVEGRSIELHVRGSGPEVILVMATIHGNEPAGTPMAHALLAWLDTHPEMLTGRSVLVMPDCNPDGHVANTRANANGVDLNRNFVAPNRRDGTRNGTALSETEAAAVARVVRLYRPARILSIHQPLACVDWDGPAEALAQRVAEECELPVRKLGTRPGSFGAWAEAQGVALVTLELPRDASQANAATLWKRYGDALLTFVAP